jgi:tripartite-type tricarboxylate transporter receptor subunit TctC
MSQQPACHPKLRLAPRSTLRTTRRSVAVIAAALTAASLGALPASAQAFQQHKQLSLVIAGSVGSAYNSYGRVLARHMKRHIPGEPDIIVKNMHGAGGDLATEYMNAQAPKDGSMLFLLTAGSLMDPLLNPARFKYDPRKFEYLGTMNQDTRVCMTAARSPVKTFADARAREAIMAGTQPGSSTVDHPLMLNALAGTKFKLVQGYKGTTDAMLAIDRGEAEGMCTVLTSVTTMRPQWLTAHEANMLMYIAINPAKEVATYKIPSIFDLVSADVRPVMEMIATPQVFGRPVLLPAGTPAAQVKPLREAFMATMKDPEFLKEADKTDVEISPLDGQSVAALVTKIYSAPREMVDRMAKAMKPGS